jgi:hypothetical protein
MTTVEILEKARELISDRNRWAKGHFAKTKEGRNCNTLSEEAFSFCSLGALCKIIDIHVMSVTGKEATETLRRSLPSGTDIAGFNDTHRHSEVIALFDRAIAAAREA